MYRPRQIDIPVGLQDTVAYTEHDAPADLQNIFYYSWELRTTQALANDFWYWVLPDICTDSIFDLYANSKADHVFVMVSGREVEKINLGKQFRYMGIRFLPGVLQAPTVFSAPIAEQVWQQLKQAQTSAQWQAHLATFIRTLLAEHKIHDNELMRSILAHSDQLRRVSDLEMLSGYTTRHLRRIFAAQTGLTPNDFIKILRFQDSFNEMATHAYADQSHLIKEYKRITGVTPGAFKARQAMSHPYNTP